MVAQEEILGHRVRNLETQEITQAGNGAPGHTAADGTYYWDYTNADLYINDSGVGTFGNSWQHIGGGGVAIPHQLLDNPWHTDTTTNAPVRGDVITAQGVAPVRWNRVIHPGVAGQYLRANAADPGWSAILAGDLPALGGVPNLTYGVANAAGVAATYVQTDATLAVFDAVMPSTIQCDDAAVVGVAAFAARRDHKHAIVCAVPANIANANAEGVATSFARSDHVHNHPAGLGANLHHNQVHTILSVDHSDTTAAAVMRGDLMTGQVGPTWARLPIGPNCSVLHSDGTDVEWSSLAALGIVSGTGVNTQVTYWTGANTIAGDAGMTYVAGTNTLTVGAIDVSSGGDIDPIDASGQDLGDATHRWDLYTQAVIFGGATGTNVIIVPDNVANALYIQDAGAIRYLKIISTNAQPVVIFNENFADIDFIVGATGHADALQVRGADGQITLGVLGAGFVQSTAGGVLSSAAIVAGDLPAHTHSGAGQGGSLVIGTTDTDATAGSVLFAGVAGVIQEDNANFFWDDTNDLLGIGTIAPTLSGAGTGIDVYDSGTLAEYKLHHSGSGTGAADGCNFTLVGSDVVLNNRENGYLAFYTNNIERVRILAGGDVGIGITPAYQAHILESDAVTAASTDVLAIEHQTSGTAAADFGAGILYRLEDAGGTVRDAGDLVVLWQDAGAAENAEFQLWLNYNGNLEQCGVIVGPDANSTDGNQRGLGSVDWQTYRAAGGEVASGDFSVISGGAINTVSGDYSAIAGGYDNVVSGDYSAVPGGQGNTAVGDYSLAFGLDAIASHDGEKAHAAGSFTTAGDAQHQEIPIKINALHDDASWHRLLIDGVGQLTIPVDTAWNVNARIIGATSDLAQIWAFGIVGCIANVNGATAMFSTGGVGGVVTTIHTSDTDIVPQMIADNVLDALAVEAQDTTGANGYRIHWFAQVRLSKLTYP